MTPEELKRHCDEIEDLAISGAQLPQGLPSQDQALFLRFRCLYQYAASHCGMSREQGRAEKQEILASYFVDCLNAEIYGRAVKLLDEVDAARAEVLKDAALMQNAKVKKLLDAIGGAA